MKTQSDCQIIERRGTGQNPMPHHTASGAQGMFRHACHYQRPAVGCYLIRLREYLASGRRAHKRLRLVTQS
jgi:hypothetical protein